MVHGLPGRSTAGAVLASGRAGSEQRAVDGAKRQRRPGCWQVRCLRDAQGCGPSSLVCGEGRGPVQGRLGGGPGWQETQSSVGRMKL